MRRHGFFQSSGEFFEVFDRRLGVLPDLDDVAVGIAHVTAPFAAVIVERLGEEVGALGGPFPVAGTDVGDAEIQEAAHAVWVGGVSRNTSGLSGVGPPPELRMIQEFCSLM